MPGWFPRPHPRLWLEEGKSSYSASGVPHKSPWFPSWISLALRCYKLAQGHSKSHSLQFSLLDLIKFDIDVCCRYWSLNIHAFLFICKLRGGTLQGFHFCQAVRSAWHTVSFSYYTWVCKRGRRSGKGPAKAVVSHWVTSVSSPVIQGAQSRGVFSKYLWLEGQYSATTSNQHEHFSVQSKKLHAIGPKEIHLYAEKIPRHVWGERRGEQDPVLVPLRTDNIRLEQGPSRLVTWLVHEGDRPGGIETSPQILRFSHARAVQSSPLGGSSCHLTIQKRVWEEPGDLPALRKLGQSLLVTSLLIEAASSVWIFLYYRQQC